MIEMLLMQRVQVKTIIACARDTENHWKPCISGETRFAHTHYSR